MRALIVAYCFGGAFGQTLIGVYKRGLRVGHALCDRGHEVAFYCAGRENFEDDMTRAAEQRMRFVEWPLTVPLHEGAQANRRETLRALHEIAPDVVVIGEAPLAGPLLEITLAAVEAGVPTVCLDNAYGPQAVAEFVRRHGAMYDGLVLTGPRSFHAPQAPSHVLQVPPFIDADVVAARDWLARQGLGQGAPIVVLAYDRNVEALGAALRARLGHDDLSAVFLTHDTEGCEARLRARPGGLGPRVRVAAPLPDRLHFGLLQAARLAVGKCAFMQVSECLSLGTPIVGFWFRGDFHLDYIPAACRPFTHLTDDPRADDATVTAARRLLALPPGAMDAVHDGELRAAARTCEFLERVRPRAVSGAECGAAGLGRDALVAALRATHPGARLELLAARVSALREFGGQRVSAVVCRYRADSDSRVNRLWLRRFAESAALEDELAAAADPAARRRVRHLDRAAQVLVEDDVGEAALPDPG